MAGIEGTVQQETPAGPDLKLRSNLLDTLQKREAPLP